jgi:hypothetical protein
MIFMGEATISANPVATNPGWRLPWFAWRSIQLSEAANALAELLQGDDDLVHGP